MAFFNKGRKDEDYDYDDEELIKEDNKLTKKFRDLKKENKRKRKEPPKPWGKKERMIVLVTVFATVLISVFLAFSSGGFFPTKLFKFNSNLLNFKVDSFNPFREQTIVIQKK
jgi:hypothetical protein